MSIKYNDSLHHLKPVKGQTKSWLTLFKMVDVDDSGSIAFDELVNITRNLLKLSKAEMLCSLVVELRCIDERRASGARQE